MWKDPYAGQGHDAGWRCLLLSSIPSSTCSLQAVKSQNTTPHDGGI